MIRIVLDVSVIQTPSVNKNSHIQTLISAKINVHPTLHWSNNPQNKKTSQLDENEV